MLLQDGTSYVHCILIIVSLAPWMTSYTYGVLSIGTMEKALPEQSGNTLKENEVDTGVFPIMLPFNFIL